MGGGRGPRPKLWRYTLRAKDTVLVGGPSGSGPPIGGGWRSDWGRSWKFVLTVLLDTEIDTDLRRQLCANLTELGVDVSISSPTLYRSHLGVDAVATPVSRLSEWLRETQEADRRPRIAALGGDGGLLRSELAGAPSSVLPDEPADARRIAIGLLATASGFGVLPLDDLRGLAVRLEEPPPELADGDEEFLRLLATYSVERAGVHLGVSRRQAQRMFKSLRERLGLRDHLEAAVSAARWGFVEHSGHAADD